MALRRMIVRAACAGALLLAAVPANADPPRVRLAWVRGRGADRCPDTHTLASRIAEHAGREVVFEGAAVTVEASVARAGAAWEAQVFVRDADGALLGERTLRATDADCAVVTDAVAAAVTVSLDDEAVARAAASSTVAVAPTPAPSPTPAPTPAPVPSPAPAAPSRAPRWGVSVQVQGGISVAALPAVSGLVALRAAVRIPRGPQVYLRAEWLPAVSTDFPPGVVRAGLVAAGAGVCPLRWRAARVELSACAGVGAGVLTLEGVGFTENQRVERPWLAVELGASLRWSFAAIAHLAAGADVVAPLLRDTARVEGVGDAFQPPVVSLRPWIGVGVHFE